jgi:hypothetical protein
LSVPRPVQAGYWSSGGVGAEMDGWANSAEVRALLGADGECRGEADRVLGFFFVGCPSERTGAYKARRGSLDDKVQWRS